MITELLTPQLFVSLFLVILVILISLLCKDEEYQINNEKIGEHSLENQNINTNETEKMNKEDINDQKKDGSKSDKTELEKKIREEVTKEILENSKNEALNSIKTELTPSLEALDGYVTLFVSGKLGELNEEQKYTAELILKKSEQIKKIIA